MIRAPLALLVLAISALTLVRTAHADPRFEPRFEVSLTNPDPQTPSNVRLNFRLESGPQIAAMVFYIPRDWGIIPGDQMPVGMRVGFLHSVEAFGFINSPCNQLLDSETDLYNATLDPSLTVSFSDTERERGLDPATEGFGTNDFVEDKDKNGLWDAIDHYPDFLDGAIKGEQPLVRLAGIKYAAGIPVLHQLVIFRTDSPLSTPDPEARRLIAQAGVSGYPMMLITQNFSNPDGSHEPSPITDFCSPRDTTISFGIGENGQPLLVNPQDATYGFTLVSISKRDADGDGYENSLDTCPLQPNLGSPAILNDGDDDGDGNDKACDPNDDPINGGSNSDQDADSFSNRQDNCPIVPNGAGRYYGGPWDLPPSAQSDQDLDDIGDACDPNPGFPDGEALVSIKSANVVVGEASGSGGPPAPAACPPCYRPSEAATEGGDGSGQLAVAAGLIALGAGAGAIMIGGGTAYMLRRRRHRLQPRRRIDPSRAIRRVLSGCSGGDEVADVPEEVLD